jgi:hypothetical protein
VSVQSVIRWVQEDSWSRGERCSQKARVIRGVAENFCGYGAIREIMYHDSAIASDDQC